MLLLTPILPIFIYKKCQMQYVSFMSKMTKCHILRICYSAHIIYRYGNMGVKRCVRTSGMQTNAIKLLLNGFNSLECQNTDFWNFPLYFLKFPLYNVSVMRSVAIHSTGLAFMFFQSTIYQNTYKMCKISKSNIFDIFTHLISVLRYSILEKYKNWTSRVTSDRITLTLYKGNF